MNILAGSNGNPASSIPGPDGEGNNNSGALSMFTQPTNNEQQQGTTDANGMQIDLDDLFHDCYFGDFPVPPFNETTVAAPVPSAQVNVLPPIATNVVAAAPQTVTLPVPVPAASPAPSLKRKDPPSLEPTPVSVLSTPNNAASYAPPQTASAPAPTPSTTYSYPGAQLGTSTSSRQLTDQQKVERRNRNREHAKRSRLRKKFLLESLQEQIHGLQSEIEDLKGVIRKELPDKADSLLEKINGKQGQFTPLPMPSGFGPVKTLMEPDFRLMSALSGSQQNFAISDPSLPDNPIVYVSQGFLDLTGYTLDQVLGRNCRFLQGPGTDQSAVDIIRKGVREGVDTSVCLLNYKADGTPFWNQFFVAALRDAENNVVNFVGVQCEVSKAVVESQMSKSQKDP